MPPPDLKPNLSQDQEQLSRLRAEAKAPLKGCRQILYLLFAASALTGGVIFFLRLLAGEDISKNLPNLAVQLGIFGLMVGLWKWEQRP
jgi:Low psii accumulation1 / Rep27